MDIEKQIRSDLIQQLGDAFNCVEEAWLINNQRKIRCDVLARPRQKEFQDYLFAFECKRPSKDWHYAKWARAIKQGIDSVGSMPIENSLFVGLTNTPVTCAFLYPAPFCTPSDQAHLPSALIRDGFENAIAGMFHLALMFRCGRAGVVDLTNISYFNLSIGPQSVWSSRFGFQNKSHDLLRDKRPFGSTNRS